MRLQRYERLRVECEHIDLHVAERDADLFAVGQLDAHRHTFAKRLKQLDTLVHVHRFTDTDKLALGNALGECDPLRLVHAEHHPFSISLFILRAVLRRWRNVQQHEQYRP